MPLGFLSLQAAGGGRFEQHTLPSGEGSEPLKGFYRPPGSSRPSLDVALIQAYTSTMQTRCTMLWLSSHYKILSRIPNVVQSRACGLTALAELSSYGRTETTSAILEVTLCSALSHDTQHDSQATSMDWTLL